MEFAEPSDALEALRGRFPEARIVEDPGSMQEMPRHLALLIEHPEIAADLPLDLRGSDFELRVWNALRAIPAGRTATYGELAARIGAPREV
jgi:AraC family transcriptional regulator of adaptative response/methylated-DNA-[protein]-cysteine methyltransferase